MYYIPLNEFAKANVKSDKQPLIWGRFVVSYQNVGIVVGIIDTISILISILFTFLVFKYIDFTNIPRFEVILSVSWLCCVIFYYVSGARGLYRLPVLVARSRYRKRIFVSWAIVTIAMTAMFFLLKDGAAFSLGLMSAVALVQIVLLFGAHWMIEKYLRPMMAMRSEAGRRVVTVGEPIELTSLSATFLSRYFGLKEVARISVVASQGSSSDQVLVNIDRALHEARDRCAEEFVIALSWSSKVLLEKVRDQLRASPLPVRLLPDSTMRSLLGRRALLTGEPVPAVELQHAPLTHLERALKRALDIMLASTAIIILSPILMIVAIAIKLDSPGPVLFRQRRNGFNANKFTILKFRTMTVLEDGPSITQACRGDHRVTRVGQLLRRSSVDELPQLINVVKGDMSLVGPRPHALAHDKEYNTLIAEYAFRHHVKPGITGWAQVNGLRGETKRLEQMAERVNLDLWYISHWSFVLDIKILVRTCFEVVQNHAY